MAASAAIYIGGRSLARMAFQLIIRNRATQDIRRQASYILANGNWEAAERFLEFAEYAFAQLAITPNMGRVLPLLASKYWSNSSVAN